MVIPEGYKKTEIGIIPEGYKKTEIGIIPEDWDVVPLLEKCQLINGLTYHPTNVKPYGILVLRSSNIQNDDFAFTDNVFVDIEVSDNLLIKSEDILICVRNGSSSLIGKCAMASKNYNATFGAFMAVLRGNNNGYIYQLLLQKTIQKAITKNSDSAINQITNGDLKKVQIPFPTAKKERDTIVSYLSDLDILIKGLNRLITKKKNIKQGAVQELLTGKRRLPGFDGKWTKVQLSQVLSYEQPTNYIVSSTDYSKTGTPVITAGKSFILGYTTEDTGICSSVPIILFDDFLTLSRYIGFPFKVKSSAVKLLSLKSPNYDLHFIFEIMQRISFPVLEHQRHWISQYSKIEITIPKTKEEQTAIATVLSDMDNEIEELEKKLAKYRCLKQGMMSELLTGHIRLTEKEDA